MDALEYEEVLKDLECPVCTNHMMAPIYECSKGHSICNDCYPTVKECPTCRAPKTDSDSRNYTLEKIVEKIKIPCKYTTRGCTFKAKGIDIRNHADYCDFGDTKCLSAVSPTKCQWIGQRQHLLNHYRVNHKNDFREAIEFKTTCENFSKQEVHNNNFYIFLINAYNKTFMLYWKLAKQSGYIPWCVYYLGDPKESFEYSYKIMTENPKLKNDFIKIEGKCQSLKNIHSEKDLQKNSVVTLKYEILKSYCYDNGALPYQVTIIKLDDGDSEIITKNYVPKE